MKHGKCRLHGGEAELHDSHIIPRWAYKRALQSEHPGGPNLVRIQSGVAFLSGKQESEYLLCRACENKFKLWEDYVAGVSRQPDGTFPALMQLAPLVDIPALKELRGYDGSAMNTDFIVAFAASVIWRASVSTVFPDVTLGARYEEEFRLYLEGKTSFPENARVVLQLIDGSEAPIDEIIISPQTIKSEPYHIHRFTIAGMMFLVPVGGSLASTSTFTQLCLSRTKRLVVGPGTPLLKAVGETLGAAQRKGKLARKPSPH